VAASSPSRGRAQVGDQALQHRHGTRRTRLDQQLDAGERAEQEMRLDLRVQQAQLGVECLPLERAAFERELQRLATCLCVALAVEGAEREHRRDHEHRGGDEHETHQPGLAAQHREQVALHRRQVDQAGGHRRRDDHPDHLRQPRRVQPPGDDEGDEQHRRDHQHATEQHDERGLEHRAQRNRCGQREAEADGRPRQRRLGQHRAPAARRGVRGGSARRAHGRDDSAAAPPHQGPRRTDCDEARIARFRLRPRRRLRRRCAAAWRRAPG
jgi:hypothetical protein